MTKFKLSLPLKISDLRDALMQLQQELTFLRSAFRGAGLTSAQGQMLIEIERSGPMNIVTLTHLLGLDKSTVSQTLAQLQRHAWVELREDSEDRRYKQVRILPEGERRVSMIHHGFDEQLEQILSKNKETEKNAIAFGIGLMAQLLVDRRLQQKSTTEEMDVGTADITPDIHANNTEL